MTTPFTITTTREISPNIICDQICSAVEGGSNYWLSAMTLRKPAKTAEIPNPPNDRIIWYGRPALYEMPDFEIEFVEQEEHKQGRGTSNVLTRQKVLDGLTLMATQYPDHFKDLVEENGDADTSDAFLQCSLFGELIYG